MRNVRWGNGRSRRRVPSTKFNRSADWFGVMGEG
jgi:hypothetical protein